VATVANVTVYLTSIGWEGGFLTEGSWTILMIGVGTIIYLLLINFRNMREAAAVGIWAFIGIAVRHWESSPSIAWMALAASLVLFISAGSHAYKNRATLPFIRRFYE
jgi:hypothetical protein